MKNVIKLFIATFQTGRQVSQHSLECYGTAEVFIYFHVQYMQFSYQCRFTVSLPQDVTANGITKYCLI